MTNAIVTKKLTKCFRIQHEKKTTLFENILGLMKKRLTYEILTAVDSLDLEVRRGETLGVIGPNGSGKSTLLRMIAGTMEPTSGTVSVDGRVSPFLELGVGFQDNLTGKENIILYGTLMGLSRQDIESGLSRILEFSGLERFCDTEIGHYSDGMRMRLAFSTAIESNGDVYLVDEAFAVGDERFRKKCLKEIRRLKSEGRTILLVTHSTDIIDELCDRAVLLDQGRIISDGNPKKVVEDYKRLLSINNKGELKDETNRWGTGDVEIVGVKLFGDEGKTKSEFRKDESITVRMEYKANRRVKNPEFGLAIHSADGSYLVGPNNVNSGAHIDEIEGCGQITCRLNPLPLRNGRYQLSVAVHGTEKRRELCYDFRKNIMGFSIGRGKGIRQFGNIDVGCRWEHVKNNK
ncbi:MAG: ABC transporter ATP-binding protein [Candidatus Altiarchaeota archaeon]